MSACSSTFVTRTVSSRCPNETVITSPTLTSYDALTGLPLTVMRDASHASLATVLRLYVRPSRIYQFSYSFSYLFKESMGTSLLFAMLSAVPEKRMHAAALTSYLLHRMRYSAVQYRSDVHSADCSAARTRSVIRSHSSYSSRSASVPLSRASSTRRMRRAPSEESPSSGTAASR